jgi:hypothetical protein
LKIRGDIRSSRFGGNLPPAAKTTQGEMVAKFAAGVADTGGAP